MRFKNIKECEMLGQRTLELSNVEILEFLNE